MAASIELSCGQANLLVDLHGAFLTHLKYNRKDILFPRTQLVNSAGELKTRGGLHVCLPNFGPDNKYGLRQHGFGRELDWNLVQKSGDRVLLELIGGSHPYEKLKSALEIILGDRKLELKLTLENLGNKALDVAPAFHPYFATGADEKSIVADGEDLGLNELFGTIFRDNVKSAKINNRIFIFSQTKLSYFAIWTDLLGDYICIEPSFAGNSFIDGGSDRLGAGQLKVYKFGFCW